MYTIFVKEDFLVPVDKNVKEEDLFRYGNIVSNIYSHYDADKSVIVGYILESGHYAIKNSK